MSFVYISEKTFKPFYCHPFVMVSKRTLKYLKILDLKRLVIFGMSYDDEEDDDKNEKNI